VSLGIAIEQGEWAPGWVSLALYCGAYLAGGREARRCRLDGFWSNIDAMDFPPLGNQPSLGRSSTASDAAYDLSVFRNHPVDVGAEVIRINVFH